MPEQLSPEEIFRRCIEQRQAAAQAMRGAGRADIDLQDWLRRTSTPMDRMQAAPQAAPPTAAQRALQEELRRRRGFGGMAR